MHCIPKSKETHYGFIYSIVHILGHNIVQYVINIHNTFLFTNIIIIVLKTETHPITEFFQILISVYG